MSRKLTLQSIESLTHDVHHLVFDKPEGLEFTPGQAIDMALDRDGWREEKRPFTFTSLPGEGTLEFVIKSYPESADGHDGVTERIGKMQPGDTVLVEEPWGAIEGKGDGVFIAGGAGVTPFIAILRKKLAENGTLAGNTLVFSNKTEADIILRESFEQMAGLDTRFIVTDEEQSPLHREKIDAELLAGVVSADRDVCYVCGPDPMLDDMAAALKSIGVSEDRIVMEEFD
ncbi:FAD-binding oxidoreductase [Salipiger sp. PrR002]|uniref:FAD-binding oxidoreductase n=1 Tax=Salipiger sp. PrR002 TaxID=2706489 RepID=UPI0013B8BE63|nr:FAD-binding oxidoreductase [Salipiger sp. PrR002]NDV99752.1 flavodoxin reductase [Salipiger sp. PrR002]NDW56650.1 flavodoxin reductase [Salipiger sp. PrR004]